jgi:hypothetical protein
VEKEKSEFNDLSSQKYFFEISEKKLSSREKKMRLKNHLSPNRQYIKISSFKRSKSSLLRIAQQLTDFGFDKFYFFPCMEIRIKNPCHDLDNRHSLVDCVNYFWDKCTALREISILCYFLSVNCCAIRSINNHQIKFTHWIPENKHRIGGPRARDRDGGNILIILLREWVSE